MIQTFYYTKKPMQLECRQRQNNRLRALLGIEASNPCPTFLLAVSQLKMQRVLIRQESRCQDFSPLFPSTPACVICFPLEQTHPYTGVPSAETYPYTGVKTLLIKRKTIIERIKEL